MSEYAPEQQLRQFARIAFKGLSMVGLAIGDSEVIYANRQSIDLRCAIDHQWKSAWIPCIPTHPLADSGPICRF
jgi:hypothetical protein